MAGRLISLRGTVQGVGFRPYVFRLATRAGITGSVRNGTAGLTISAFAEPAVLDEFVERLACSIPAAAQVCEINVETIEAEAPRFFAIEDSDPHGERSISISAELALCEACLAELEDPNNRRHGYPFINCTDCGPRYTVARSVPYDRDATSMREFAMCSACAREYADPRDRRFHSELNACPDCGPKLWLEDNERTRLEVEDPIAAAAELLRCGGILAIKGLGGFHLACDATNNEAVLELRKRKRRNAKPFALMVRGLAEAEQLAILDPRARNLLSASERPIVLVRRREPSAISAFVAPDAPRVGLMLPYTGLHHLLLAAVDRPLVMTSGNASDEPIAIDNEEARRRLSTIADLFLFHDRDIENRADDSVMAVIADRPAVVRRSRGFAPRAMRLAHPVSEPVLAVGGQLKNTVCIAAGDSVYFSPHIGDLENLEIYEVFQRTIARLENLLGVRPRIVAHDLHPEYLSTRYAQNRSGAVAVGVQHHHAHVVSAIAEHRLSGPVYGVVYDGTGYGTDGTMWGGEIIRANAAGYTRIAAFRAVPLPGGDRAIREPWRIATGLICDAFDEAPPLDRLHVDDRDLRVVRTMLEARLQSPLARGVGRYFDGVAAIALHRTHARFEGQLAMALEHAADPEERRAYPYELDQSVEPWSIDLRPAIRELITDLSPGRLAARFHNTVVAATADVLRRASSALGELPVVLTGGCFQNVRLSQSLRAALEPGMEIYMHQQLPTGDGGLALGQAIAAEAMLRERGD